MLGLKVEDAVPARPDGPAVACKVQVGGTLAKPEATVQVATTDGRGTAWVPLGKPFPLVIDAGEAAAGALADELLKRLVTARLTKGAKAKGKETFAIKVENNSPLILNGLAPAGAAAKPDDPAKYLLGIALAPRRTLKPARDRRGRPGVRPQGRTEGPRPRPLGALRIARARDWPALPPRMVDARWWMAGGGRSARCSRVSTRFRRSGLLFGGAGIPACPTEEQSIPSAIGGWAS